MEGLKRLLISLNSQLLNQSVRGSNFSLVVSHESVFVLVIVSRQKLVGIVLVFLVEVARGGGSLLLSTRVLSSWPTKPFWYILFVNLSLDSAYICFSSLML